MENHSNNKQTKFSPRIKITISLIGGIASSALGIPVIIWLSPFSYKFSGMVENILGGILYKGTILYPIALALGLIGLFLGIQNVGSNWKNYAIVGIILSAVGIGTSLLFLGLLAFFTRFQ